MKKKTVLIIAAILAVCFAFAFAGCGVGGGKHVHNYGELVPEKPATCTEEGMKAHYFCEDCGKYFDDQKHEKTSDELKIAVDSTAHKWGADGKCEYCSAPKPPYDMSGDGTKIYFGEYPQSEVKESGLKAALGSKAGDLPAAGNANGWTDYGYHAEYKVQSYMWYKDVEHKNERYRGVYFTSYRPEQTSVECSEEKSFQDDNGYHINTVYWFKFEPIEWRILEQKDGTALLMSNMIIDSRQYQFYERDEEAINTFGESDIKAFLNGEFYNAAFGGGEKDIISNSAGIKVFLLDYTEVAREDYGFNGDEYAEDAARCLKSTAYARAQGLEIDDSLCGGWWLWSDSSYGLAVASAVKYNGKQVGCYVGQTKQGVVPALRINL